MTAHLRECAVAEARATATLWGVPADAHLSNPPPCICERLRACEERVSSEYLTPMALATTGFDDPRYAKGYAAALDAAREAVASMEIAVAGNSAATVDQALAVIDALKEER